MRASTSSKNSRRSDALVPVLLCFVASAAVMAAAAAFFYHSGGTLAYGDAEAHLNIARRVIDSRTPGWFQLGTTWLPLPHLLLIPLVRFDSLWQSGLAGAIVSGAAMSLAAAFLFAAVQRLFANTAASTAAVAVFLLNPNTLYLGSIPMTEPIFFASLFALLYFTVRFSATQGWGALLGASLAALAGTLTRYEAWLLLPFVAAFVLVTARRHRWLAVTLFCFIAGAGPALWLAHNRWYYSDALYFYRGPWSALAIQGSGNYPGRGDWRAAVHFYFAAGQLIAGLPALLLGAIGVIVALIRGAAWPVLLLALPPVFYIWSVHSSGTPIYVPTLVPNSFYNIRYALALVPLIALGTAAAAHRMPHAAAFVLIVLALSNFLIHPAERPITWQEADANSRARRQWISAAADFLRAAAGPNETYFTGFGDLTAIYRTLGIPLRDTLTGDNEVAWYEAVSRPDLFLHTDWAIVMGGDDAQTVIDKARLHGPRYELSRRITVKGAPAIEIYRRLYENPVQ